MIKKVLIFSWTLVKQLVVYTLSVIPASVADAWDAATDVKRCQSVRVDPGHEDQPHRRKRRGHRGGRKHRKFHHH